MAQSSLEEKFIFKYSLDISDDLAAKIPHTNISELKDTSLLLYLGLVREQIAKQTSFFNDAYEKLGSSIAHTKNELPLTVGVAILSAYYATREDKEVIYLMNGEKKPLKDWVEKNDLSKENSGLIILLYNKDQNNIVNENMSEGKQVLTTRHADLIIPKLITPFKMPNVFEDGQIYRIFKPTL